MRKIAIVAALAVVYLCSASAVEYAIGIHGNIAINGTGTTAEGAFALAPYTQKMTLPGGGGSIYGKFGFPLVKATVGIQPEIQLLFGNRFRLTNGTDSFDLYWHTADIMVQFFADIPFSTTVRFGFNRGTLPARFFQKRPAANNRLWHRSVCHAPHPDRRD
ncbi:MAG: hypothetical protein IJ191_00035 [Treponema sp.]|nr:hypothetical protein [Treponema sp.]